MKAQPDVRVVSTGADVFVFLGGIKIAKRGHPDTPQAKPGFRLKLDGKC
jgi:hypothetical protein